jgi:hypothetical protein
MRAAEFLKEAKNNKFLKDVQLLLSKHQDPAILARVAQMINGVKGDQEIGEAVAKIAPIKPLGPVDGEIEKPADVVPGKTDNVVKLPTAKPAPAKPLSQQIKELEQQNLLDHNIHMAILSLLQQGPIEDGCRKIIKSKFTIHLDHLVKFLTKIMVDAPVDVEEKLNFLENYNNGLIDVQATLLSNSSGNIFNIKEINTPLMQHIRRPMAVYETGRGANTIGKGEFFIAFIGKGCTKGNVGDVRLPNNTELEVKTSDRKAKGDYSGGVLHGLKRGKDANGKMIEIDSYDSVNAKRIWAKGLAKLGIPFMPSINKMYLARINQILADSKNKLKVNAVLAVIKQTLGALLLRSSETMLDGIDSCYSGNQILVEDLTKAAHAAFFDYYKENVGHDSILFFNAYTGAYEHILSGEDLVKKLSIGSKSKTPGNFFTTSVWDSNGTSYADGIQVIKIV